MSEEDDPINWRCEECFGGGVIVIAGTVRPCPEGCVIPIEPPVTEKEET